MRKVPHDIELDRNMQPVFGRGKEILDKLLPGIGTIAVYLLFLGLGFCLSGFSGNSPLVNMIGGVLSFVVLMVGWVVAFLVFGVMGGNFVFANSVFLLIKQPCFRTSIAALFIGSFLANILARVIRRAAMSYSTKIKLLYGFLAIIVISFVVLCAALDGMQDDTGKYFFMYLLLAAAFLLNANDWEEEKPKTKFRFPAERRQTKQKEEVSPEEELKRMFQDLV